MRTQRATGLGSQPLRTLSTWATQFKARLGWCEVTSSPEPKLLMATVSALIPEGPSAPREVFSVLPQGP